MSQRDTLLQAMVNDLVAQAGHPELQDQLSVRWNSRLRTTAGMACFRRKTIFLNPLLAGVGPHEVERTLRHELAHFIACHRAGRRRIAPHGPEWRKACGDLGILHENRCHNLPVGARRLEKKFFYQCPSCGSVLARVRRLRGKFACLPCCRKHSDGKYDDRFRLVPVVKNKETGPE